MRSTQCTNLPTTDSQHIPLPHTIHDWSQKREKSGRLPSKYDHPHTGWMLPGRFARHAARLRPAPWHRIDTTQYIAKYLRSGVQTDNRPASTGGRRGCTQP
eukprot:scaffold202858_cov41-Tisochrysis_lutea.AAC.3